MSNLPVYIAPKSGASFVTTDIFVYGPVGASAKGIKVVMGDKQMPTSAIHTATDKGRPVVWVQTTLEPATSGKMTVTFAGAAGKYGMPELKTTPMLNDTATTVTAPGCHKN
jgi:hypothetical protein